MAKKAISNATVQINDETISIVPNSLVVTLGRGETNVRAASAGGGTITTVHTENAENKIAKITFDVYPEKVSVQQIDEWKQNIGGNTAKILSRVANDPFTMSMVGASLMNDPEMNLTADGVVSLEFMGDPIQFG
jgi:hypothetical protein